MGHLADVIHPETTFELSSSVVTASLGDELVVLDTASGEYYGLNATAAVIWRDLERGMSVGEIAHAVQEAYDIGEAEARTDVDAHLSALSERRLILPRCSC